jgi:hypothetical protein
MPTRPRPFCAGAYLSPESYGILHPMAHDGDHRSFPPAEIRLSREQQAAAVRLASGVAGILLIVVVVRIPRSDLGDWAEALGSLGTFILSLLGSAAAIWWWRHRGSAHPRLRVAQSFNVLPPSNGNVDIYTTVHLTNVGEVPVVLTTWRLWACQMAPLPQGVQEMLSQDPDHACRDFKLPWLPMAGTEFEIALNDAPKIRAGEAQDLGALLRVPADSTPALHCPDPSVVWFRRPEGLRGDARAPP